jgi:hypothetical protein
LANVKDGIVTVVGKSAAPFLGVGADSAAPGKVTLRIRCANGGEGRCEWIPPGTSRGNVISAIFAIKPGEWQDISVNLPGDAKPGIFRVYVPAQKQSVQIDWIELETAGKPKRWNF